VTVTSPSIASSKDPSTSQAIPAFAEVVILGAGAAGLMCALTAARQGRQVLVLEKANKVGKKILMSGGGRCNFTNYVVEPGNYISANPHFAKASLQRYSSWDFIAMVEQHRIDYEERKHGQLFCKGSAKQILRMLLDECQQVGVQIVTHSEPLTIAALPVDQQPSNSQEARFELQVDHAGDRAGLLCQSLVVATGALSIPTLGGSGLGYEIAEQFGLPVTSRRAGLVPLMFSDATLEMCQRLSGLALEVEVSVNGRAFTENLLFTHRGISGPAILQISNYWLPGDSLLVDLLPGENAGEWLRQVRQQQPTSLLRTLLSQKLARSLVLELQALYWHESADTAIAEMSDMFLDRIAGHLHRWLLKPSATEGYRTAEVTLGGVDTGAVSSKTMEARDHAGLYFIGEVLDVSGHLGGFNFQWAWASGYSAGLVV
jgi:predicted Rossmann fold flavoprotein